MQQLVPRLLFCLRNSLAEKKKEKSHIIVGVDNTHANTLGYYH
jgi:hypothetical protein